MSVEKSLGEQRVRTSFNPTDNSVVQNIKERAAHMINYIDQNVNYTGCDPQSHREALRLKALALTAIEEAAMWAVKAATA